MRDQCSLSSGSKSQRGVPFFQKKPLWWSHSVRPQSRGKVSPLEGPSQKGRSFCSVFSTPRPKVGKTFTVSLSKKRQRVQVEIEFSLENLKKSIDFSTSGGLRPGPMGVWAYASLGSPTTTRPSSALLQIRNIPPPLSVFTTKRMQGRPRPWELTGKSSYKASTS